MTMHDKQELHFEPSSTDVIQTAAARMAATSPFVPAAEYVLELPRFLPAAARGRLADAPVLSGRFVGWELCGTELRLRCALDALDVSHGAPSCLVGGVEGVEPMQRLAFMSAVGEAFPLTHDSTFLCRPLAPAPSAAPAFAPAHAPAHAPTPEVAPGLKPGVALGGGRSGAAKKAVLKDRLVMLTREVEGRKSKLAARQQQRNNMQQQQQPRRGRVVAAPPKEGGAAPGLAPMDVEIRKKKRRRNKKPRGGALGGGSAPA